MTDLGFADHFGEGRDDNPYWNESVWFSLSIPERHVHGMIQYYFRPNMGMLNGGPVLWDPSGTFQHDCLHYQWSHLQALPAGTRGKFDMQARNSLSCRMIEPMHEYKLDYDRDGLLLDLTWTAIGPAHELRTGDAGQASTARFHIEQPGRMTGTVTRHGEEWRIDCWSMRDTSYGAREYDSLACGGYFWGIADGSAFHAIAMGEGTQARAIGGFIWKDGKMASLASGRREVLEWGRFGPARVLWQATDTLGRSMEATGIIDPGFVFTGYTDHSVVWSLVRWEWDGVEHWGDNQEFAPAERFRRIARGEIALGERRVTPGRIVVVNGTSGSGKSTTCELFQKTREDYWMLYGIDHFTAQTLPAKYGHHGPLSAQGIEAVPLDPAEPDGPLRWRFGPSGMRAFATFHEWMAATSRQGLNVVFDHLLMSDPPVLQDLVARTEGLPVLLVTLKPPFEVLERRVAERRMDKKIPTDLLGEDAARKIVDRLARLRPWFYEEVYRNSVSDLTIDTALHDPQDVCAMISARLAQGPGTAFDRLRAQFKTGA